MVSFVSLVLLSSVLCVQDQMEFEFEPPKQKNHQLQCPPGFHYNTVLNKINVSVIHTQTCNVMDFGHVWPDEQKGNSM